MTEPAHRVARDHMRRHTLLARLAAVENALESLEHEVRGVDNEPVGDGKRSLYWLSPRRDPSQEGAPQLIVEIAA